MDRWGRPSGSEALMLALPCATPETVEMMGFRRSILLVRTLALIVLMAGVAPLAFASGA